MVRKGHQLLKKTFEENLATRCDSFVVETSVHFPTDINLLYDAIRKMIEECKKLSQSNELMDDAIFLFNIFYQFLEARA